MNGVRKIKVGTIQSVFSQMGHGYMAVSHLLDHQITLILQGYFSSLIQKVGILGHSLSSVPFVPFAIFRPRLRPVKLALEIHLKNPYNTLYGDFNNFQLIILKTLDHILKYLSQYKTVPETPL